LLDITIQVVCDVAIASSEETHLYSCVEFVEEATKYGCGYLSTRTIGYVLRFYLFIFYFGLSTPTGNWGVLKASDKLILEDPRTVPETAVLPGGAPQSAILSLKDLLVFLVARLGSLLYLDRCVVEREMMSNRNKELGPLRIFGLVDIIVADVVDSSVHRVDIANLTQLASHQILRSGGSELFWFEMINSCGAGLFGKDSLLREESRHLFAICFSLMANYVKIATSHVRKNKTTGGTPRDTVGKLMSLEMIKFFLDTWDRGPAHQEVEGSHSLETFAFCIRRLVVPCLLANTSESIEDPRVFRRTIKIVGTLWCSPHFRKHMKLELGFLFDHFVIRLLLIGPQILFKSSDDQDVTYLFAQQLEVMKELKNWFCDEDSLVELFLNFDTEHGHERIGSGDELLAHVDWKVCRQLCASLCHLAEKATAFLGEKVKESQSTVPIDNLMKGDGTSVQNNGYEGVSTVTLARESARRLRQGAFDAITQLAQQLAVVSAAQSGYACQSIVNSWKNKETLDLDHLKLNDILDRTNSHIESAPIVESRDDANCTSRTGSLSTVDYWQRQKDECSVYSDRVDISKERRQTLTIAFGIAKDRGLSRAIDYLMACNVLSASPRDIASFLRIHRGDLCPMALGKYLGERGSDLTETEYWNLIRFSYIRAISFVGMTVEEG
jgi:hypothetical protein